MRALSTARSLPTLAAARLQTLQDSDEGMTTAEYAVGTVAACGFSGVLYKLITSDAVMGLLEGLITKAFTLIF